jgi:hypothetical protein
LDHTTFVPIRGDNGASGQLLSPILVGHAGGFTFGATMRGFFIAAAAFFGGMVVAGGGGGEDERRRGRCGQGEGGEAAA